MDERDNQLVVDRATESVRGSARDLTPIQRNQKLYVINKLALRGMPTSAISAHPDVNLPDSTVANMLRSIKAEWINLSNEASTELRARELAKLDHMEDEAWQAWEASKEDKRRDQVNAEIKANDGNPTRVPKVSRTVKESRTGDPRYLDIVFRCIDKRIKILGLADESAVGKGLANANGILNTLELRISQYRADGVFDDGIVAAPGGAIGNDDSGESVDSERSASEAGEIPDVIEPEWRPA